MVKSPMPQPKAGEVRRLARRWRAGIAAVNASGRCTDRIAQRHSAIHSKLIEELDAAQESEHREEIEEVIEFSKPWGDLRAAMKAPPRLVEDLLQRQQVQIEQLTGRGSHVARWGLIVAAAIGVFVVTLMLVPILQEQWQQATSQSSISYTVSRFFQRVAFRVKQTSFEQRTAVFAIFVLVVGGWLLTRPGRA